MIYPTAAEMQVRVKHSRGLPADRFAASYVVEANGCWRWVKGTTTSGYGHFHMLDQYFQAHRIAYVLHRGPIPAGMFPDHLCRNRWCVNPWHLEIVTHRENCRRGSQTRLNSDVAARIRAAVKGGLSQRQVAPLFGVDHSTVSRIMSGRLWADARQDVAA